jgi:hypothetical protein
MAAAVKTLSPAKTGAIGDPLAGTHVAISTGERIDCRERSHDGDPMISRSPRRPSPTVHLPLPRVGLCLDCEECFEIGFDACPACGSEAWVALARFLEKHPEDRRESSRADSRSRNADKRVNGVAGGLGGKEDREIVRHLLIVARNREQLYGQLKEAFSGNERVQVIVDRRTGERRQRPPQAGTAAERRKADRRRRDVEEQLRTIGWALVLMDEAQRTAAR